MNFQDLKNQKKVHFIGLGGIGMSALALLLREFSVPVQGSDLCENYLTSKLQSKDIDYVVGQKYENIGDDVSLVIKTSIIKDENPEIRAAKDKGIPIITRAELLAIVMQNYINVTIAGTHGKTSTTAMTSLVLEFAALDPVVVNGGVIHYFGSNAKIGKGKYLVAESDESDGSFVDLPTDIGAITNIEAEHLEHPAYGGSFEKQKQYYEKYVRQIGDKKGFCAICVDDEGARDLYEKLKGDNDYLFSYSIEDEKADLCAKNIRSSASGFEFDVAFKDGKEIKDIKISAYGIHNISNALVAIAISNHLGISFDNIKVGLSKCSGVKRRFTKVGDYLGAPIIDDYAHHPTEIIATLKAARQVVGDKKIVCVLQPHKYSRLSSLFDEFCNSVSEANYVIVCDIYSAGQESIEGARQDDLVLGIKKVGHENVIKLENEDDLARVIKPLIQEGDMVLCVGAGNITYMASNLEEQLKNL
ncbi:MAG: UDP-N-acetylmuramate--L-alanine ligase [Rickettsiales bacterium]|nr:UDP-N-acetylmuramate--L-alanine ligase [Rickettsiales bacterium]